MDQSLALRQIRRDIPRMTATEFAAHGAPAQSRLAPIRKFAINLPSGERLYNIRHELATTDVLVQTRIAGRVREGGISIIDENTVRLDFGGVLNEKIDVVIIG